MIPAWGSLCASVAADAPRQLDVEGVGVAHRWLELLTRRFDVGSVGRVGLPAPAAAGGRAAGRAGRRERWRRARSLPGRSGPVRPAHRRAPPPPHVSAGAGQTAPRCVGGDATGAVRLGRPGRHERPAVLDQLALDSAAAAQASTRSLRQLGENGHDAGPLASGSRRGPQRWRRRGLQPGPDGYFEGGICDLDAPIDDTFTDFTRSLDVAWAFVWASPTTSQNVEVVSATYQAFTQAPTSTR